MPKKAPAARPARTTPADPGLALVDAALALAKERGWRSLTLAEIAAAAKLSLDEACRHIPSKTAILDRLGRLIDEAMLAEGAADPEDSPRDRLFDLLMRRFDALQERRAGIAAIARDLRADPLASLALLPQLERSMRWTLEAAGIGAGGLTGLARVRGLGLLYLAVIRVWLRDDSEDMAPTMKALDQRLSQAERIATTIGRGPRLPRRAAARKEADQGPE